MESQNDTPLYSIGAAANLSGLSPSTIRTWERRHGILRPQRAAGGGRRYTDEDIERLELLRSLTAQGETISILASLSLEQLRERSRQFGERSRPEAGLVRVALMHENLGAQMAASGTTGIEVACETRSPDAMLEAASRAAGADLLIAQFSLLGAEPADTLQQLLAATGAKDAVVEYRFARREQLRALTEAGVRLVRGPATVKEIIETARSFGRVRPAPRPSPPSRPSAPLARRFDGVQLARLREITPNVECECPNHLATLVAALQSFEDYCRTCVDASPEDAEMHARLAAGTGRARGQLEDLLVILCAHDGIAL